MKKWLVGLAFVLLVFYALFHISVPYYVMQPGSTVPLAPMVKVEKGYQHEAGTLRLTTVSMGPATAAGYLYAMVDPSMDVVHSEEVHSPYENDEQYAERQLEIMKFSQDTATLVAFRKAGLPVHIQNNGAVVMELIPGLSAEKVLKIGDIIVEVNGKKISTAQELVEALQGKKSGEKVSIAYLRGGRRMQSDLELKPLPVQDQYGKAKPGIGIASPVTDRKFTLPRKVTIKSEGIGGPSAGLMFTLEIINQLTQEDLTKGYQIAGTGTMGEDGSVGPIGGIEYKIMAAHRDGVDIFFAPSVKIKGSPEPSNYDQALITAKKIKAHMKIVPVRTVDDALAYLKNLSPKK